MNRLPRQILAAALPLALAGCSGEQAPPLAVQAPLDRGWIAGLLDDPDELGELFGRSSRDGWIAFHRGDDRAAAEAFAGQPLLAARALLSRAAVEEDLARLSRRVWLDTFALWEAKSGLPAGSAIPLVAAVAALDAQDLATAGLWLEKAAGAADPAAVATAAALKQGLSPIDGAAGPGLCINAHLAARASGDAAGLGRCGLDPWIQEPAGGGLVRRLYDPLLLETLSQVHRTAADRALEGVAPARALAAAPPDRRLDAMLFSPWWSAADLEADAARDPSADPLLALAGAFGPTWTELGPLLPDGPASTDAARARVRALDAQLDPWRAARWEAADPDGRALLDELGLVELCRGRLLLAWSRAALKADRPSEALVYAQLALDLRDPRALGPVNSAGLFVALAEASYRIGHTRESLDALSVLSGAWPELDGLDETLGDLAILQGIGRQGDSKEN